MAERMFLDNMEAIWKQPMVYDTMDERYRDKDAKNVFWSQIATVHGFADGKQAAAKWEYVRAKYRKDKKALKLPSSSAATGRSKWPYFEELGFLGLFNLERDSASSTLNPASQLHFPDTQEDLSGGQTEDTFDDDSNRISSFNSTPGSKRINKNLTPLEKRFMSSMATQEKVMAALTAPSSAEEQSGQDVAAQLTSLKEQNPQAAGWAKLQIETVRYNAQFPALAPPPSTSHARHHAAPVQSTETQEERVRYLENSSSTSMFDYHPNLI